MTDIEELLSRQVGKHFSAQRCPRPCRLVDYTQDGALRCYFARGR
jgi:hypothetical protein